jgi:hypothetical protein
VMQCHRYKLYLCAADAAHSGAMLIAHSKRQPKF